MKKLFLSYITLALLINPLFSQIEVNTNGEVGIVGSPISGIDFYTPEAKITKLGVGTNPSSSFALYSTTGRINTLNVGSTDPGSAQFYSYGISDIYGYYASQGIRFGSYSYYSSIYTQMHPTTNYVGYIGKSNQAFYGVYAYCYFTPSDERQKENISYLTDGLNIVKQLQAVRYDLKQEVVFNDSLYMNQDALAKCDEERKGKVGFLAQEVNEVFPEAVIYDDSTDVYAIDYTKLIPVLAEAIKEQQNIIENLESKLNDFQSIIEDPSIKKSLTSADEQELDSGSSPVLYQNNPNPFSENTIIKYYLPEASSTASIIIYDMNGKQLKSYSLMSFGQAQITISSGELEPGMFLYTLLVDSKLIDTKQMIITKQ